MHQETKAFILAHRAKWPQLEIDDLIKALYQSAFGCGHFAPGEEQVLEYLRSELSRTQARRDGELVEPLLRGYSRVHIAPCAARGMSERTLARLFMLTANEAPGEDARAWFDGALNLLGELAEEGALGSGCAQGCLARLRAYREAGCPSIHHSVGFNAAYHPAYRVVRSEYAQLLDVFAEIDRLLDTRERVLVVIDGNSGAGKSTLAQLLASVYDGATVVHMDDFFLQAHQRTQQRLAQPGGNVDYERFYDEALLPMRRGEAFDYRPFDCARMAIGEGRRVEPGKLCIVEGSYSLHPALESAYDLKILLRVTPAVQAERILKRNGAWMLGRFLKEWIPLENAYFEQTDIEARCDLIVTETPQDGGLTRYDVRKTEGRA